MLAASSENITAGLNNFSYDAQLLVRYYAIHMKGSNAKYDDSITFDVLTNEVDVLYPIDHPQDITLEHTSISAVFCCKLSIKLRASVPGVGRQVNTTVFLGSSAHLIKSSLEKPHVRSATDASTTFGSGILARSARLWHKAQYL